MKKKLLSILLSAAMLLSLTACGSAKEKSAEEAEKVTSDLETITVTDQNGMEVTIPANPDRLVTTALPLPSIYALTGAPIEYLVGVHPGSTSAIENSIMAAMYPELKGIADNFIEGTDVNVEELLKLEPDVVLYWAEYLEQYEAMKNAGIPAVGVKTQDNGNVLTTLESWLNIMKEIFGDTGNIDKVIEYGRKIEADIAEKTAEISDEEKPKVLYLYNHSSEDISVSGADFYGDYWIKAAGGINAAAEVQGATSVNMEQIYEWNPDIIIISTFTETMPEDLYNNTIDGQDWSQISAVLNGKVIKEPLGVYRWFPPSGDAPLMLKWMAQTLHPDKFTYDMKEEIQAYYKEFYNYSLEDEQIEGILSANPEAAKGAGFGGSANRS
ncbi:MAG: ABC transporter substrate-binding protein [Lachnospiraceae bacterium]|nr:ABC transporter substrate-binding protein [Lachnospiraceae bacterium]